MITVDATKLYQNNPHWKVLRMIYELLIVINYFVCLLLILTSECSWEHIMYDQFESVSNKNPPPKAKYTWVYLVT